MVVTKPEDDENQAAIADKPTEGTDIFTVLSKLLSCSSEERLVWAQFQTHIGKNCFLCPADVWLVQN